MAAVSVSAQNTRLDDAETTTNWGNIGGGGGGALETDFKYQGSNCFARKAATAQRGFYMSDDVNSDMTTATGTYQTWMVKYICTTPGLLESSVSGNVGQRLEIGSGSTTTTQSSNFYYYDVQYSDTYPVDKSWLIVPIDPNIASHRTGTTGSPNLSQVDYYGIEYDQTGTSKSPNQGLDAVDIGAGLTLIGGDGADADGVWQDFSDHDWGTSTNRYGYVRELEGIYFIYGQLVIGTATATVFTDSGQTLVFPDGLFAAGFSGITVDVQNSTSVVDFSTTTFLGRGTATGEDTRPVLTVTGTSGTFDATDCVFDAFGDITLNSVSTITGCTFSNCGAMTQSSATIDGCSILGATTGDGVAFITSNNPSNIKNCDFTFSDGHAIEITATGTYNMDGHTFTGYGADGTNDAAVYNNSGGAVTLDVINNGNVPTVRNGAGASTTVNNSVIVSVSGLTEGAAVKIIARETVGTVTLGDVLSEGLANSSGVYSYSQNYEGAFDPSGLDVTVRCRHQGFPNAAIAYDHNGGVGSTYTDETTASNSSAASDMNLLPSGGSEVSDAYYFGHNEEFGQLRLEHSQVGSGDWLITWEYWNGSSWAALTGVTDGTQNGLTRGFGQDGVVSWTIPGNWADTSVNSQGPYRYVRGRVTSYVGMTTQPIGRWCKLDTTRYLPFNQNRTITSSGLDVVAVWVEDTIASF